MYHYFQDGETSPWLVVSSQPKLLETLAKQGAKKVTILAVSEQINEDTDRGDLRYKGPLYFDIDCGGDLDQAADSTRELVARLHEYGVDDHAMQVFASGSKGFHVVVPERVFSTGRPVKNLPRIYKSMALDLYVPGLDFQVYSGGRGNTFRIPNVQRDDGRYRVPLLPEELSSIQASNYLQYVSKPRDRLSFLPDVNQVPKALPLEALFQKHMRQVKTAPSAIKAVPEANLAQFTNDPPACIEQIAEGKVREGVNFNQVAMQFSSFVARSGTEQRVWKPLANRAADKISSHTYDTHYKRREHLEGQVRYAYATKGLAFSCFAMRTVTGLAPCDGCPIFEGAAGDNPDAGLDMQIEEREDGYYLMGKDADRKLSNFTLLPVNECIQKSQAGGGRRIGTEMDVMRGDELVSSVMFDEASWSSKAKFVAQFEGFRDLSFIGTDADVQRIKTLVYKEGREMGEIVVVHAAGVHAHQILNKEVMVYVEPGLSINSLRVSGTHRLSGTIQAPPKIADVPLPHDEVDVAKIDDALFNLMQINHPEIVAQLVGWFCAAHLKTHFQRAFAQFPILTVWGAAGAGKTTQTSLVATLSGADYILENSALNLSSVTPFALIDYCSTTTTIPRMLDEFNKTRMDRRSYNFCTEIIKAAWNGQMIARGRVGRSNADGSGRTNAHTQAIPISSPLVILGEQAPDVPAIQQRSLMVLLTRDRPAASVDAFNWALRHRASLMPVAKTLVLESLKVSPDWVRQRVDMHLRSVPEAMMERPRFTYAVTMSGLDFLETAINTLGLGRRTVERLDECRQALKTKIEVDSIEISRSKSWSEVDNVIREIGEMAAISQTSGSNLLIHGKHLTTDGETLYLDLPIVFAIYVRYVGRPNVIIDNPRTFEQLLRNEDYFLSDKKMLQQMVAARPVWALDIKKMADKGHTTSLFFGA